MKAGFLLYGNKVNMQRIDIFIVSMNYYFYFSSAK